MTITSPINSVRNRAFDLTASDTVREIGTMLDQVQRSGGALARWRIARSVNLDSVVMMQDAIQQHIHAKSQELDFRIAPGRTSAKKAGDCRKPWHHGSH